jgi:hypothetical protein
VAVKKNLIINNNILDNVLDQIIELSREFDYNTYDFTVDFLVSQFNNGYCFINRDYHRKFDWDQHCKCCFIESILLRYPVPTIFLSDNNDGRREIIDGAQRISTLEQFLSNDLVLSNLKKLTKLNGYKFDQLPPSIQRKFRETFLRTIVLDEGTSLEVRAEFFNRINSSRFPITQTEI